MVWWIEFVLLSFWKLVFLVLHILCWCFSKIQWRILDCFIHPHDSMNLSRNLNLTFWRLWLKWPKTKNPLLLLFDKDRHFIIELGYPVQPLCVQKSGWHFPQAQTYHIVSQCASLTIGCFIFHLRTTTSPRIAWRPSNLFVDMNNVKPFAKVWCLRLPTGEQKLLWDAGFSCLSSVCDKCSMSWLVLKSKRYVCQTVFSCQNSS